jgi:hypothetical protein
VIILFLVAGRLHATIEKEMTGKINSAFARSPSG